MQSEAYPAGSPLQAPLVVPDEPCPDGYLENHWKGDLERGWRTFEDLMSGQEDRWQGKQRGGSPQDPILEQAHSLASLAFADLGERAGVRRSVFNNGQALHPHELECTRGVSFFDNVQALDVFSCIYNPGFRLIWDHRIKEASILQRFSQAEFLFYMVIRGIGPIYWPRDYIGIEGVRFYKPNGQVVTDHIPSECNCIDVIWTSVDNPPSGPQEGKVRGRLNIAAYRIQNRGNGCDVTFMISLTLSVPIPAYIRRMLVAECPLSLARLRDSIPTFGVCPYVVDEQSCLVIQRHFWDAESRKSHMRAFSIKPGTIVIMLDTKRMYPSGEQHAANCQGAYKGPID